MTGKQMTYFYIVVEKMLFQLKTTSTYFLVDLHSRNIYLKNVLKLELCCEVANTFYGPDPFFK